MLRQEEVEYQVPVHCFEHDGRAYIIRAEVVLVGEHVSLHLPFVTNLVGDDLLRLEPWGNITIVKEQRLGNRDQFSNMRDLGAITTATLTGACEYISTRPELTTTVSASAIDAVRKELETLLDAKVMVASVQQVAVLKQIILDGKFHV